MSIAMIDPGATNPFYTESLCQALSQQGAEVTLLTAPFLYCDLPSARGFERKTVFSRFLDSWPSLVHRPQVRRRIKALVYPLDWNRLLQQIRQNPPSVVHLQWPRAPLLEIRFLQRLKADGIPLVITVHNSRPHAGEPTSSRGWKALWDLADAVICPSRFTRDQLRQFHPSLSAPVKTIPLGHFGYWRQKPLGQRESRRRLGLPEDQPLALYYGLIKPYKGLPNLLSAFESCIEALPTAQLALCGAPRYDLTSIHRGLTPSNSLPGVHTRFDYLNLEETSLWFEACDLVVLPYEAASQSMIPAMAYTFKKPVLSTTVGAFPEQILPDQTGRLVPPGQPRELGRHLLELLRDRDRCQALGERGFEWAWENWNWATIAKSTLQTYRDCQ